MPQLVAALFWCGVVFMANVTNRKPLSLSDHDLAEPARLRAKGGLGTNEEQALALVIRTGLDELPQRSDEAGYTALAEDPEWRAESSDRSAQRHRNRPKWVDQA